MKKLKQLDHLRSVSMELRLYGAIGNDTEGVFALKGHIVVIASSGEGWDHISVSRPDRTPTWDEMEKIKRLFFEDHETVMQLHVPVSEYIDGEYTGRRAKYCLHLWRPIDIEIPRPPDWMVGNKSQVKAFKEEMKNDR